MFSFIRNLQTVLHSGYTVLHSHQNAVHENFCRLTSLPTCGVVRVLDFGHSNRWIVVYHCYFNLHFPDNMWCGASFLLLTCCLYIFFGEVSVKVFGPFLNQVVSFLSAGF